MQRGAGELDIVMDVRADVLGPISLAGRMGVIPARPACKDAVQRRLHIAILHVAKPAIMHADHADIAIDMAIACACLVKAHPPARQFPSEQPAGPTDKGVIDRQPLQ